MLMLRQHIDGPPNYAVVSAPDYTAPPLPAGLDYAGAFKTLDALGREAAPSEPLRLIELRTWEGRVAGHVQMGAKPLMFDLLTRQRLPAIALPPDPPGNDTQSARSTFKFFHRFNYLGQAATGLNALAGLAFAALLFTGLAQYLKLYRARVRLDRPALAWRAGGWWRDLHRGCALIAGVLVIWITATGFVLSLDNFGAFAGSLLPHPDRSSGPHVNGFSGDLSSPISAVQIPAMTATTLAAFKRSMPGVGIKALRLRYFAGYPQGVVVAANPQTSQLVFNAETGRRMSMTEPGYPQLGFPLGWEWHQRMKLLHRGDYFGMPGRWLDALGGLAMLYLATSGGVMYSQLYFRRRRLGRAGPIWR